ncbi:MAG TPA: glycosyltransferase family 4 protein [Pyrinomonadaceae bacterium]|jgi:glycosyltransferase involved in cell wall biosynthesis|nr:glycosyltransferase family 4 protein [Pyrinomonadaceae bacterium]
MARISILTPTLVAADAVSNDVLGMLNLLERRGHEVQLFADDWNVSGLKVQTAYSALSMPQDYDDVLIYHHSIGWELGERILQETAARVIVKYHNVTPAAFFEGLSPKLQQLCIHGRAQLNSIARGGHDLLLAASEYNRQELLDAEVDPARAFVVPPFSQVEALQAAAPNMDVVDNYSDGKTNLVNVGNVRPNKGHVDLLEAFAHYYYSLNSHARLFIVGGEDETLANYSQTLRSLADLLCIDHAVVFTGRVSLPELKSYYLVSDAFVVTSHHEGFCVPLVEAMGMKVPITGYATTAIAETIGGAGVIWPERDPSLLAESIDSLVEDESIAVQLGAEGRSRYDRKFSKEAIEAAFLTTAAAAGFEL